MQSPKNVGVFVGEKKLFILMNCTGWILYQADLTQAAHSPKPHRLQPHQVETKPFAQALFCISERQLWVEHIKNTSRLQAALEFNSKQPHICFPASTWRRPPPQSPPCGCLQQKVVPFSSRPKLQLEFRTVIFKQNLLESLCVQMNYRK